MFQKFLFVLSVISMASLSVPANASTTAERMELISAVMEAKGYTKSHSVDFDDLAQGKRDTINYTVTANKEYVLVGLCDKDCSDLDLSVIDKNGNVVEKDYKDDGTPIVGFTAGYSGDYKVRVDMEKCSTSTCYYRVQAFRKE